jgi:hypothetical protein
MEPPQFDQVGLPVKAAQLKSPESSADSRFSVCGAAAKTVGFGPLSQSSAIANIVANIAYFDNNFYISKHS